MNQLGEDVLDVLRRSVVEGDLVRLPDGQLSRKLYEAVNTALTHIGGKWNRHRKGHVFATSPQEKLDEILGQGFSVDKKKVFQAFYTPEDVADEMAIWAQVEGHDVLEPSAGHGALAEACLKFGAASVDCIELDEASALVLKGKGFLVIGSDFLSYKGPAYERIVMNPPFTRDQDVKHVEQALRFLAPRGILVAIMAGNTTRSSFTRLTQGRNVEIRELADGSFKSSGTMVRAVAVKFVKGEQ